MGGHCAGAVRLTTASLTSKSDFVKVRLTGRNWSGLTCRFGLIDFVDGVAEVTQREAEYLARLLEIAEVPGAQVEAERNGSPHASNHDAGGRRALGSRRNKARLEA